jgi:hypothetical protein
MVEVTSGPAAIVPDGAESCYTLDAGRLASIDAAWPQPGSMQKAPLWIRDPSILHGAGVAAGPRAHAKKSAAPMAKAADPLSPNS